MIFKSIIKLVDFWRIFQTMWFAKCVSVLRQEFYNLVKQLVWSTPLANLYTSLARDHVITILTIIVFRKRIHSYLFAQVIKIARCSNGHQLEFYLHHLHSSRMSLVYYNIILIYLESYQFKLWNAFHTAIHFRARPWDRKLS